MKLSARDLPAFLKDPARAHRGALVYGPDSGGVMLQAQALRQAYLGPSPGPFALVELSEEQLKNDPTCVGDALASPSLLGGKRLIWIRQGSDKQAKTIQQGCDQPAADAFLLVCAGELPPRSPLRQLFEKRPELAAIACYKEEGRDLEQHIRAHLEHFSLHANREALAYLCQYLGNDQAVTRAEIEKLSLYLGNTRDVTLEDAGAVIGDNRGEAASDALCAALAGGDTANFERLLGQMWRDGAQPIALLRSVQRYLERLYQTRCLMDQGTPPEEAIAKLSPPVFFRAAPAFKHLAQVLTARRLRHLLARLAQIELQCKSLPIEAELLAGQQLLQMALPRRAA